MGCGCGGNKVQAVTDGQAKYKIVYRGGVSDGKTYATEVDATLALRRSGRVGEVKAA